MASIHTGEPLQELLYRRTVLEVFEQGGDRHAGSQEHPCPTELAWVPFDCWALIPFCHFFASSRIFLIVVYHQQLWGCELMRVRGSGTLPLAYWMFDEREFMLDFNRFQWISFDCYGTLVDWETGISEAVGEVLESHGVRMSREEILGLYADIEPRVQGSEGFLKYREVLRRVMELMGSELGLELSESELGCLTDTLPGWPVFPDTVGALRALKERYRLAVISNVDDDLFTRTSEALEVEFDAVVTAEQVGSYKPNMRNFEVAMERMGVEKGRWLHVAESLYHDIGPANRLGIQSVWVNRADRGGGTRRTEAIPDVEVPDLGTLAGMACAV